MKRVFDKRTKYDSFNLGYKVLKWDARYEDKGKHGKFDNLWKGPYTIFSFCGNNSYFLKDSKDYKLVQGLLMVGFGNTT